MAQKTKRQRKRQRQRERKSRSRSRIRSRSNETEPETSSPMVDLLQKVQAQAQAQGEGQGRKRPSSPVVEKHHFYSKMFFDGNTMTTESQKDNEPVKRRKYTLKQLEQEIPIGAELVKRHLNRKVPPAVNAPFPRDIEFTSVLPNPIDLGLMPPLRSHYDHHDHHSHDHNHNHYYDHDHTRHSMKTRRKRSKHHDHNNEENIKLFVNELS